MLPPAAFSNLRPQQPRPPGERDTEHRSIEFSPAFGGRQEAGAPFRSQSGQVAGESGGAHRLRDREPGRGTRVSTTPESAHSLGAPPPPPPQPRRRFQGPGRDQRGRGRQQAQPREAAAGYAQPAPAQPARAHLGPRSRLWAHFRETCGCASLGQPARDRQGQEAEAGRGAGPELGRGLRLALRWAIPLRWGRCSAACSRRFSRSFKFCAFVYLPPNRHLLRH